MNNIKPTLENVMPALEDWLNDNFLGGAQRDNWKNITEDNYLGVILYKPTAREFMVDCSSRGLIYVDVLWPFYNGWNGKQIVRPEDLFGSKHSVKERASTSKTRFDGVGISCVGQAVKKVYNATFDDWNLLNREAAKRCLLERQGDALAQSLASTIETSGSPRRFNGGEWRVDICDIPGASGSLTVRNADHIEFSGWMDETVAREFVGLLMRIKAGELQNPKPEGDSHLQQSMEL